MTDTVKPPLAEGDGLTALTGVAHREGGGQNIAQAHALGKAMGDAMAAGTEQVKQAAQELIQSILPVGAFRTEDHRYYFNGQGPVPSVTTVLEVISKPALVTWKAKEAARAMFRKASQDLASLGPEEVAILWALSEADKQRDTAAKLGTGIHLLADMASRGQEPGSAGFQPSPEEIPYLEAWRGFESFLKAQGGEIVSSEHMVWSLNGYGGTYDLILMLPTGSSCNCTQHLIDVNGASYAESKGCSIWELWLLDIKSSKGIYPEYGLQLAAYRWADSIILPNVPTPYPMPEIQRTGVLHLRPDQYPDTGWRLIEYPTDYKGDYLVFLGALEIYKWRKEGRFTKSNLDIQKPRRP